MSVDLAPSPGGAQGSPQAGAPPTDPHRWGRPGFRRRLSRWDYRYGPYAFVAPFFLVFAAFGLFPFIYTAWVSLHDWQLAGTHTFIGLDNYVELVQDPFFWNSVRNTVGIFLIATIPQLLLALVLAETLNRRLRARTFFRMGILLPNVTSVAAVAIVFSLMFARDFGVVNWALGLVGVENIDWRAERWSSWLAIATMVDWRWTGYNALIYLAAMQAIPRDVYEAAALDGASGRRQFWSITIPMLRPTIIFTVIVSTIGGIQLFTEPLLFNSGAGAINGGTLRQFQTVMMYTVENAFYRFDFGYGAAIAWMVFLLALVVSAINFLFIKRIRSAE